MSIRIIFTFLFALAAACGMPDGGPTPPKTAITNVRVFDGTKFGLETTVVIVGHKISNANPARATIVNGRGGYLIPGLIDTHSHIQSCSYLDAMRQWGVTTTFDMGTFPYSVVTACRGPGITNVFGSGQPATVNGTYISKFPGFPSNSFVPDITAGERFVADRLAEGVDYIKIILDPLGPDLPTLNAMVTAAHDAGKLVITHAPSSYTYGEAAEAHPDLPCHVPLDMSLNASVIEKLIAKDAHDRHVRAVTPTLIMMQSIANNTGLPLEYYTLNAAGSATAMHSAGMPITVGTDSNLSPYTPANPPFGVSMHDELELLVGAGLSPVDALLGATSRAAHAFRLHDRGAIRTGLRADLVLLGKDPLVDIGNSRAIERVWVGGVEAERTGV
jgi:imidazolonepropionase-like amidohydrolase